MFKKLPSFGQGLELSLFSGKITIESYNNLKQIMKRQTNDKTPVTKRTKVLQGFAKLETQAQEALDEGKYSSVVDLCQCIHRIDPTHALAHFMAGEAHFHSKTQDGTWCNL